MLRGNSYWVNGKAGIGIAGLRSFRPEQVRKVCFHFAVVAYPSRIEQYTGSLFRY